MKLKALAYVDTIDDVNVVVVVVVVAGIESCVHFLVVIELHASCQMKNDALAFSWCFSSEKRSNIGKNSICLKLTEVACSLSCAKYQLKRDYYQSLMSPASSIVDSVQERCLKMTMDEECLCLQLHAQKVAFFPKRRFKLQNFHINSSLN